MKKLILILFAVILMNNLKAQEKSSKFDFKIGSGMGFMGSGDVFALCFENELNYKLNKYFSSSVSLGIGRTVGYTDHHNDYLQGSLNLFVSPFKNNKANNFKIGAGYTLINEQVTYLSSSLNNVNVYHYYYDTINGFNVILEDEYRINSKFLIGGKAFMTAGVAEGGILIGVMLKVGIVL